jgi:hypothetical protein
MSELHNLSEARERMHESERRASEARALYLFFKQHPELNLQANEGLLRSWHNGSEITDATLNEALQYPGLADSLARKSDDRVQKEAEEEIQARRDAAIQTITSHRQYSSPQAKIHDTEHLQSQYVTLDELERTAAEILESVRLSKLSVQNLRAIVRPKAPAEPVVNLPMFTREHILAMSGPEMRRAFCRPDGTWLPGYKTAVDKILRGES